MTASRERRGTIKDSDVIQTKKATLEDIGAIRIFAIYPPRKVQKQLMKNLFKETAVGNSPHAALYFVDAPRSPGVNRWIDVAKGPLISGQLAVRVHIPFAKKKDELLLGKIRINKSKGNAVKREVPGRGPWIFPLVRDGDNVVVVEMGPFLVTAFPAFRGRCGAGRVAFEPGLHVVVIKLLRPQHARVGLAHHVFCVRGEFVGNTRSIELI